MDQTEVAKSNVAAHTQRASSAYVPPLQRTAGQPPLIAEGEGQRVADRVHNAPPGAPIETKWGLGFRKYDECMAHIRGTNAVEAPEGGFALPLPYTVFERHTYS